MLVTLRAAAGARRASSCKGFHDAITLAVGLVVVYLALNIVVIVDGAARRSRSTPSCSRLESLAVRSSTAIR